MSLKQKIIEVFNEYYRTIFSIQETIKILKSEGKISEYTATSICHKLESMEKEPLWKAIEQMIKDGITDICETSEIGNDMVMTISVEKINLPKSTIIRKD